METAISGMDHICKNCSKSFTGNYCNHCGEKAFREDDKKFSHLFEEVFHFFTHLDNKFLRTIGLILFKPSALSKAYCEGQRKKFFKPISLFIIVVILYLLFPLLQGVNISMASHIGNNESMGIHYPLAWSLQKMKARNWTEKDILENFDNTSPKVAKLLLFILLPLTALILLLLHRKRKHYFFDHFILSTELVTQFILLFFILLPLLINLLNLLFGISLHYGDTLGYSLLQLSLMLTLLTVSFHHFYQVKWGRAILNSFLFLPLFFIVIFVYRQLVFITVMLLI